MQVEQTEANWNELEIVSELLSGIRISNMRRIDSTPTRDTLVELLHNDALGRNEDLAEFAGILKSIEGGFSLFVDADWEAGRHSSLDRWPTSLKKLILFLSLTVTSTDCLTTIASLHPIWS